MLVMDRDEANARVIASRAVLAKFKREGVPEPDVLLPMMRNDVSKLKAIALEYPEKAETLARLCNDWEALIAQVERGDTLH